MEVNFSTDLDGFLSQECPSCNQQFKVLFGQGSSEPISFCPYCGFEGKDCWWTQEQADHAVATAFGLVVEPEIKKLQRKLKSSSKGLIKLNSEVDSPGNESPPIDVEAEFTLYRFPCHDETIKAHRHEKLFCIICGQEKDVCMSESKKVFLSHKSIDKALVIDFKETLTAIGYEPWLDEDAMPAGTSLDRALLQGMQDSCGVVFFITPAFKDEGFLENEINYAMQQKREKKEKFSIITLQFADEEGNSGDIPELLKQYVWKKPATSLQALKEIIRALPIHPSTIEWRDGIDEVVNIPKTRSRTAELSKEAKSILSQAVQGDSEIYIVESSQGIMIASGGKNVVPSNVTQKDISYWKAGMKDLRRHGLIEQADTKGQRFKVTREGYEFAEQI